MDDCERERKAREAFRGPARSKVFQAHQETCYVMSHISLLEKRRRTSTWRMNPCSPPDSGGGARKKKKSLKLAEEIIVRAKTDAGEEKRSLLFFSWVHPLSKSVIISELFSSPRLPSGFNTMFTLPNFTYVFSPFLVVPFSRIASKCDYKYRTHSAPPCVPPATMRIMENLNPQLLLMRLVVSLSRCSHRERFSF